MTTIMFYVALGIIVFILISRLPGMNLLLLPIFSLITGFAKGVMESGITWLVYFIKTLYSLHRDVITHLVSRESDYDIELKMKEKTQIK